MIVSHVHEWTVVCLSGEPIGASCECGESRGFEPPQSARLGYGDVIELDLASSRGKRYAITNLSINHLVNGPSTMTIDAVEETAYINERFMQFDGSKFQTLEEAAPVKQVDDPYHFTVNEIERHLAKDPSDAQRIIDLERSSGFGAKGRLGVFRACWGHGAT